MAILLNNKEHRFKATDLPCLISYKEKTGGSQFSISLVVDLFKQGHKILFLTAYPMAKENFIEQTMGLEDKIVFVEDESRLAGADKFRAVILKSGDEQLFQKAIKSLLDIKDRLVFVKNMEVFSVETIKSALKFSKLILSGDIDRCPSKEEIAKAKYQTTILFSQPEMEFSIKVPALEKYSGYMVGGLGTGVVKIKP